MGPGVRGWPEGHSSGARSAYRVPTDEEAAQLSDDHSASSSPARQTIAVSGFLHLLVVYVVWGTTYLFIRIAVRDGGGFAPFALGATRLLVAGTVLTAVGLAKGESLKLGWKGLAVLAFSAICLWNGGNGFVMLGETRASSGLAALLVSTSPIWAALIETVLDRRLPSAMLGASLAAGFAGLVVLSWPSLAHGVRADVVAVVFILLAPMCWSIGSVAQKRSGVTVGPLVGSGYQQLVGGMVFVMLSWACREPIPHPTPHALLAWGYLVVFGSLMAFTSYTLALRLLPMSVLMTYAYVNPVVAVFLGWLVLGEHVGLYTIVGTMLVILSVAGTFRAKFASRATPPAVPPAVPPAEPPAAPATASPVAPAAAVGRP